MTIRRVLSIALALAAVAVAPASADAHAPRVTQGKYIGTSRPMIEIAREIAERPAFELDLTAEIPNYTGRDLGHAPNVDFVDGALQSEIGVGVAVTPPPSLVFGGASDDDNSRVLGIRIVPPDTEGDVGPNHYVQWINLIYMVYDKAGNPLLPEFVPGNEFWDSGTCGSENSGDPLVLYDHLADRWVVSQFTISAGIQCVAVSTSPDPTGSFHQYEFQVTDVGDLPDYPKMGVWGDGYYYAADNFAFFFENAFVCSFERRKMLAGLASPGLVCFDFVCDSGDCPFGVLPSDLEGPAPPAGTPNTIAMYWDSAVDGSDFPDGVRLWEFSIDWNNPGGASLDDLGVVAGAAWDRNLCGFSRNCVPQCNGGEGLDTLSSKTMWRAHARWEDGTRTLLVNSTADAGGDRAGIRWAELADDGTGWDFVQEGTYAPADGLERWMGSIAKDAAGNICVGYTVSSSTLCPSVRYTCRSPGDPPGTLPGGEVTLQAGSGAQMDSVNRWGDYSSTTIDASNGCTFWHTNEYYQNNGSFDFKSAVGAWEFSDCPATPTEPLAITSIVPGDAGTDNDWNVGGCTDGSDATVFCSAGGGLVNVGSATCSGGSATISRFVPGGGAGRTLTCFVEDGFTGVTSPPVSETF